ncbi:hypothetical protein D3C72_766050 [compost metagenome]
MFVVQQHEQGFVPDSGVGRQGIEHLTDKLIAEAQIFGWMMRHIGPEFAVEQAIARFDPGQFGEPVTGDVRLEVVDAQVLQTTLDQRRQRDRAIGINPRVVAVVAQQRKNTLAAELCDQAFDAGQHRARGGHQQVTIATAEHGKKTVRPGGAWHRGKPAVAYGEVTRQSVDGRQRILRWRGAERDVVHRPLGHGLRPGLVHLQVAAGLVVGVLGKTGERRVGRAGLEGDAQLFFYVDEFVAKVETLAVARRQRRRQRGRRCPQAIVFRELRRLSDHRRITVGQLQRVGAGRLAVDTVTRGIDACVIPQQMVERTVFHHQHDDVLNPCGPVVRHGSLLDVKSLFQSRGFHGNPFPSSSRSL